MFHASHYTLALHSTAEICRKEWVLMGKCMFSVGAGAVCWRSWRCFATIHSVIWCLTRMRKKKKRSEIATTNSKGYILVWWTLKNSWRKFSGIGNGELVFIILLMCKTEPFPKRERAGHQLIFLFNKISMKTHYDGTNEREKRWMHRHCHVAVVLFIRERNNKRIPNRS